MASTYLQSEKNERGEREREIVGREREGRSILCVAMYINFLNKDKQMRCFSLHIESTHFTNVTNNYCQSNTSHMTLVGNYCVD